MNYAAYLERVRSFWIDLRGRVEKAFAIGFPIPFELHAFMRDFVIAEAEMQAIQLSLWISDDEYEQLRASHAKANAYNDALVKAVPSELKDRFQAPPDSTKIPEPPETLGDTLGNAAKAAKDATTAIAVGGAVVIAVSLFLTRNKKGSK
jgi:hypothetical protein